ncbi:hypothetical protein [Vitiosangium sp. GDMCC 1.1324]|uniref:hypothetical protein n=1 Tax=Vitiosangium sp. (strain GDMCC 1.1324) TaxID=2138576 RepID=UPI00130D89A0|nr:hypothetical protein [Vitiosangium sp. GDMCC 1.1324]
MSEAGAGRPVDEQERQRVSRHLRMRQLVNDSPEEHLPQVGMKVAGYRMEARLGTGGQGTVFRARRKGRLFAVKCIFLPRAEHRAWRELEVMVKLWDAGGLPLEGHGLWPAHEPLFLFLVTPFVRGLPLDDWAREHNPNTRVELYQVGEHRGRAAAGAARMAVGAPSARTKVAARGGG